MSPESAKRAGNEIYRAMNEYVVLADPPSAEDMLGVPEASNIFDVNQTDSVQYYLVAHTTNDLDDFEAASDPPNRGKWSGGRFHPGVVMDPALEATMNAGYRYNSHKRLPTKVVTVVIGDNGRLRYAACVCGGDVYGVHCRHTFAVLLKKLQITTVAGTTFKAHPVSMQLSNACQEAILSGNVSSVQEQLAIGFPARATTIAIAAAAAAKKTPRLGYGQPCPQPCGCVANPVHVWCSITQPGTAPAPTLALTQAELLKSWDVATRQAYQFAASKSTGNLQMMQQLQETLLNFGRLASSGEQATRTPLTSAQRITNPSKPALVGRHAHGADRLTKGSDPVFKAKIVDLQLKVGGLEGDKVRLEGDKVVLQNELQALYEKTGSDVPKSTALPRVRGPKSAKRLKLGPAERVLVGVGPDAAQPLGGPTGLLGGMPAIREKWRARRLEQAAAAAIAGPYTQPHTTVGGPHAPVVFALSPQQIAHMAQIPLEAHHAAGDNGCRAEEDRATPVGSAHVVGCRLSYVALKEGETEVVEMLTCRDLVHGKDACEVVRGRIPVDPEFIKGQHLYLEDAIMRGCWKPYKATGAQRAERHRVNGGWDYTGQLFMEFYPKGTQKKTIQKGDEKKRIEATIDPGIKGAAVVVSCGWMAAGFRSLDGNFLTGRDEDSSE